MAMKPLAESITNLLNKQPGLLTPAIADALHAPLGNVLRTLSAMLADGRLRVDGTDDYRRWYVGRHRIIPVPSTDTPAKKSALLDRETSEDFLRRGGAIQQLDWSGNFVGELRYDPGSPDPDDAINPNTGRPYTYAELTRGD